MQELVILVGQQGAGKTTFCKERYPTHVHLSKDTMGGTDKDLRILNRINGCARTGRSVVLDNTNPTPASRMPFVVLAEELGMIPVAVWFDVPTDVCQDRVTARNRGMSKSKQVDTIGFEVVRKSLSKPTLDEGFVEIITITREHQGSLGKSKAMSTNFDPDDMGERLKYYEGLNARELMPKLPVIIRLDGRAFHSFTSDMKRPFDEGLTGCMVSTMRYLVEETNAMIGYTQSDEISLVLYTPDTKSQVYFAGRVDKITSVLPALASLEFNAQVWQQDWGLQDRKAGVLTVEHTERASRLSERRPVFDCRVFNVPTLEEAANVLLWREQDATRNSVQMAAQHYYSQTQLHKKNTAEMMELLHAKGVNWNDYPSFFKRGTYLQKKRVVRAFKCDELEKLPAKHAARTNPDLQVERWDFQPIDMPPFGRVTNRVGVVFNGEAPLVLVEAPPMPGVAQPAGEMVADAAAD